MRYPPLYKPFSHMVLTYVAARCASSAQADANPWQHVNWKAVEARVKSLQSRIAKAVKAERWNKVKVLQRMLTRSHAARLLAVRKVTQNKGKRSAGVDGVLWKTPRQKMNAVNDLRRRGYRSQPLRRVCIPKTDGRTRKLGIPTMKDRAMQALYALALDPISETLADPHSYGFRKYRCTHDAIQAARNVLSQHYAAKWILEADIKGCFDHISHEWLLNHICIDKHILAQWLRAGICHDQQWYPTSAGTPQGGIISPILANMTLDGLAQAIDDGMGILTKGKRYERKNNPHRIHLIRYADDFLVTANHPQVLTEQVIPIIQTFLAERGLALSTRKTKLTHINDGFDFLGQSFRKYKGKLLIKPAKKSIRNLLAKVKQILTAHRGRTAITMIHTLNPLLRGWAQYHRHVVSKVIFTHIDHYVFYTLWRWALRRHRNKGKRWIQQSYFSHIQRQKWCFAAKDEAGKYRQIVQLAYVPITRHIKVKSRLNPYLPMYQSYLRKRHERKQRMPTPYPKRAQILIRRQNGVCPTCGHAIQPNSPWHIHHIIPLYLGGNNQMHNLVVLHTWCHQWIHLQINRMKLTKHDIDAGLVQILHRLTQA